MKMQAWKGWVAAALLMPVSASWALDDSSRGQSWETAFRFINVQSDTYVGENGSVAETENSVGWGFGVGFNFNENFTLSGNFNWSDVDYTGTMAPGAGNILGPLDVDGELETSTININATYNVFRKAVTPFITGGFGATYLDTNIPNGPAYPVCWYDPWYGYYCGTAVPTKSETDFSYNIGVGLRWDVVDNFYLKATANRLWLDASGNIGHPSFISYAVDFGFLFR
ncbi:MAG: outer membrane protein [Moraxellaceae bacterium]